MAAKEYPTSIHLSRQLKLQLRQAAKQEKRSVSSQVRYILEEWVQKRRPDPTSVSPLPAAGGVVEAQAGDA